MRYTALIRLRKGKQIVYRESKTFSLRSAAEKWARSREVELENPQNLMLARQPGTTLRELIRWYIDTFESISKWQRNKQAHLILLERHPFTKTDALKLSVADLVSHIRARRADGA